VTLLALDAGVRETGWAVFRPGGVIDTGVIRLSRSRTLHAAERVRHLVESLDRLSARWQPGAVAYGQPAGIRWPAPALELLDGSLTHWATDRQLPLFTYSGEEVRVAIARHSRVPQDQLAYAIMRRLRLIGARKSTPEWEALAIGYYHLCRMGAKARVDPASGSNP
jgi:Holliday junction resolvasome RuvABC endonuclease subunit